MEQNDKAMKIDQLLDGLIRGQLDEKQGKEALAELEVKDAESEIALHLSAAAAVQRYEILRQVQAVGAVWREKHAGQQPVEELQRTPARLVRMKPLKMLLRVAAAVIFIVGGLLFYQISTTNSQDLYSELYVPYNVVVERGSEGGVNTLVGHYQAKEYAAAIKEYEQLTASGSREDFFAGMAYSETGNYDKAAIAFEKIIKANQTSGARLYNDDAQYYLSLSLIKLKRYDEAYKLLNIIKNEPAHTYHEEVGRWLLLRLKYM
jgi:tetratricopeptide (TPR) repeat protein